MIEDVIKGSWAFQDMIQIGRKEEKRQDLLLFIKTYFPNLAQFAQNVCDTIQTLEELQSLFKNVLRTKDDEKVHQILLGCKEVDCINFR